MALRATGLAKWRASIKIIETSTGKTLDHLPDDQESESLRLLPDSPRLVVNGIGHVDQVDQPDAARSFAVGHDDRWQLSGSGTGNVWLWRLHPADLVTEVCQRERLRLSHAQWTECLSEQPHADGSPRNDGLR